MAPLELGQQWLTAGRAASRQLNDFFLRRLAFFLGWFCRLVVVLFVVDLTAVLVFLLVRLLPLLLCECATVGGALIVDLLIQVRLIAVGARGFA